MKLLKTEKSAQKFFLLVDSLFLLSLAMAFFQSFSERFLIFNFLVWLGLGAFFSGSMINLFEKLIDLKIMLNWGLVAGVAFMMVFFFFPRPPGTQIVLGLVYGLGGIAVSGFVRAIIMRVTFWFFRYGKM